MCIDSGSHVTRILSSEAVPSSSSSQISAELHSFLMKETKVKNTSVAKSQPVSNTNALLVTPCSLIHSSSNHQRTSEDPLSCSLCTATLNCHSQLTTHPNGQDRIWRCEFCSQENIIPSYEDKPKTPTVTYVKDFNQMISAKSIKKSSPMVIFCIDRSRSMLTVTDVKEGVQVDRRALDCSTLSDWVKQDIHKTYYYNTKLGESSWELPSGDTSDWATYSQPVTYWTNSKTRQVSMTEPKLTEEQQQLLQLLESNPQQDLVTVKKISRAQCVQVMCLFFFFTTEKNGSIK